jgi:hypothetical protein
VQRYGTFSDNACKGISMRLSAEGSAPCARSVTPHHVRHNAAADQAARRLVELCDPTRSPAARAQLAVSFSHDLDAVFADAARLPRRRLHELVARYDEVVHEDVLPALAAGGVTFPAWGELSPFERAQTRHRFHQRTLPLVTPLAVDSTHPLPHLPSLARNVGLRVGDRLVLVTLPPFVPRLLAVRPGRYLAVESFVSALLPELLVGVRVCECAAFRLTRSAATGQVARLEIERQASDRLVDMITSRLQAASTDLYRLRTVLAMGDALAAAARGSGPPRPAIIPRGGGDRAQDHEKLSAAALTIGGPKLISQTAVTRSSTQCGRCSCSSAGCCSSGY